ncbi:MAG: hypothetical protein IPN02_02615 [Candidatus Microthrix sp.]|uniref:Uncharacterized protein n=1 Tax=Candidatus Neomicrothrix subdominans TaxID=2954438 RepID=A0A936N9W5_9ACTN|nr:hypothetical protein [Candidatus Microthrix subdominans]
MHPSHTSTRSVEVIRHRATLERTLIIWDRLEAWAALSFLMAIAYVTGSVLFGWWLT